MLINIIQAEYLKTKRTFGRIMIVIAPLIAVCIAFFLFGGIENYIPVGAWNTWYTLLFPCTISVICFLNISNEKGTKFFNLKSLSTPIQTLLIGKIINIALVLLLSNFILFLSTSMMGVFFGTVIPVSQAFFASLLLTILCLWEIPIYLFLSIKFGMLLTLLFSLVISVLGTVALSTTNLWWLCPSAIPVRLMCPILGVHPNGTIINRELDLLEMNVVPFGIVISLLWLTLITILLSVWFRKTEVK